MTQLHIHSITHPLIQAHALVATSGERVAVAGRSGSGKTLFLKCLADLIPGDFDIALDSLQPQQLRQQAAHLWRRQVMYVAGESAWWAATVADHFPPGAKPPLPSVLLDDALLQRAPQKLSSGQRQRLALLRALYLAPQVLLLDEPTANLDEQATLAVEQLLREWSDAGGILLFTSHDSQQRQRLATRHWQVQEQQVSDVDSATVTGITP